MLRVDEPLRTDATVRRMRCSDWARQVQLDPAGTAPRSDIFVLVEHPLPWPSDLSHDPFIAELEQAVRGHVGVERSVRLQALAVERGADTRRVIVFAMCNGPFVGYGRLEAAGKPDDLAEIAATLVATDPPRPTSSGVTDLLVCTHGARDACCGSLGTRLWRDLEIDGIQVWRTSHTGGHRFAPTAITFPDGYCWAYLNASLLEGIVHRSVPSRIAASHVRGCVGFDPLIQVADAAVLEAEGWDWLSYTRSGTELSADRVELRFERSDGRSGGYDVHLASTRRLPLPQCGQGSAPSAKSQREWRVTDIQISS